MGLGYKGLVFCRNNGLINEKHGQGTHSTKMGDDNLAKNTLNVPKVFGRICLLKSLGFSKKAHSGCPYSVLKIMCAKSNWILGY